MKSLLLTSLYCTAVELADAKVIQSRERVRVNKFGRSEVVSAMVGLCCVGHASVVALYMARAGYVVRTWGRFVKVKYPGRQSVRVWMSSLGKWN